MVGMEGESEGRGGKAEREGERREGGRAGGSDVRERGAV
jgi:hypothetical protein